MRSIFALLLTVSTAAATLPSIGASVGGPIAPDGNPAQIHLPASLHQKNKGGSDGAGLCVFTSCSHSACWQNIPVLQNFRDYMTRYPGGGWPGKVDQYVDRICKEKGVPKPEFFHVEANDLDILALAVKTGRMPGVTYSFSPTGRYGGGRIAHMVSLVAARVGPQKLWAILDNNYPGENNLEWMSEADFLRTYSGGRTGWAVIFLPPGPPPVPKN